LDRKIDAEAETSRFVIDVPSLSVGQHVIDVSFACQSPGYEPHPLTATFTIVDR
jgi:hypothetical protein